MVREVSRGADNGVTCLKPSSLRIGCQEIVRISKSPDYVISVRNPFVTSVSRLVS